MEHPLHETVAKCIKTGFKSCKVVFDKDCGGKQRIPLFISSKKSYEQQLCQVDIIMIKDGEIQVIIEIDESNLKPTQICGKFLTTALCSHYIHKSTGNKPIRIGESAVFIQILDESKLSRRTKKILQGGKIEESIQGILPIENSKIKSYFLMYGKKEEFGSGMKCKNLLSKMRGVLKSQ